MGVSGVIASVDHIGMNPFTVRCQATSEPGLPYFMTAGYPDSAASDTKRSGMRERVREGVRSAGMEWPDGQIVRVNVSPAAMPKHDGLHDLAVALSVIDLDGGFRRPSGMGENEPIAVIGGLDRQGRVTEVRGIVTLLEACRDAGVRHAVIPRPNLGEARMVEGMVLHPVNTLRDAATRLDSLAVADYRMLDRRGAQAMAEWGDDPCYDTVRHAVMAAVAGRHHMLVGCGPSTSEGVDRIMACMQSLAPRLEDGDAFDLMRIRDMAGVIGPLGTGLDDLPPQVNPYPDARMSEATMFGDDAMPGSASLASYGVLQLKDLTSYPARVLHQLREPMSLERVEATRVSGHGVVWPAKFQLAGAYDRSQRERIPFSIENRCAISIDADEPSAVPAPRLDDAKALVSDARARQTERFRDTPWSSNEHAGIDWINERTPAGTLDLIRERAAASEHAAQAILMATRLAWTMGDLNGHEMPDETDAALALGMTPFIDHASFRSQACDPSDPLALDDAGTVGVTR